MVDLVLNGLDLLFIVLLAGVVVVGVAHVLLGLGRVGSRDGSWERITLLSGLIAAAWLVPQALAFLLVLNNPEPGAFADIQTFVSVLAREVIAQKDSNPIAGLLYSLAPLSPYVLATAIVLVPVLTIVKFLTYGRFRVSNFGLALVSLLLLPAAMANLTHLGLFALDVPVVVNVDEPGGRVAVTVNKDVFSRADPGNLCSGIPYPNSYEPPEINEEVYLNMLEQADYLDLFWTHSGLNAVTLGTYEAFSCRLTNLTYNSNNLAMVVTVLAYQALTVALWAFVLLRTLASVWRQMAEGRLEMEGAR